MIDLFLFYFLKNILIILFYVHVLPACMFVQFVCPWLPWRLEEGADPLEL